MLKTLITVTVWSVATVASITTSGGIHPDRTAATMTAMILLLLRDVATVVPMIPIVLILLMLLLLLPSVVLPSTWLLLPLPTLSFASMGGHHIMTRTSSPPSP